MQRTPAQRGDEVVTTPRPEPRPHPTADLLARYGELAAELEDSTDPTRGAHLRTALEELDHEITRRANAARTHHPESSWSPPPP